MPRKRRRGIRRTTELTWWQEAELIWGPDGPSQFETPFLARAAWYTHREVLMENCAAGQRPAGYWAYEAPERPRAGESDADALARLGLLEDWEVAELKAIARLTMTSQTN